MFLGGRAEVLCAVLLQPTMNRFGLGRDIPGTTKRIVRQRCGFGCVVCGAAFYQYEHVDPAFADARVHDPEKICLLCGGCLEV